MASIPKAGPGSPHDTKGPEILAITAIFATAATFCVAGRFGSRKIKGLALGADDWTILLAMVMVWALFAFTTISVMNGGGSHIWDVQPPSKLVEIQRMLYAHNTVYVLTTPTVKFSLLLLYRRIFVQPKFHKVLYVVGGFIAVWVVVAWFMAVFFCRPIYSFWDPNVHGTCIDFKDFAIGFAAINIPTDVIIWILPIPLVWKLQLQPSYKWLLTSVFLLGLFVWAASIVRFVTSILTLGDPDETYNLTNAYIWSIVEPSVGVICACLPTLRALIRIPERLRERRSSKPTSKKTGSSTNSSKKLGSSMNSSKNWRGQSQSQLQSNAARSLDPRDFESHGQVVEQDANERRPTPPETGIQVSHEVSVEEMRRL